MPDNNSEFKNDWTLMFFFASDNPLAPLLVSQLKAIKDAGFQEHTEVLVYFDPMEKGRPTTIYNVNSRRKASAIARAQRDRTHPRSLIGDARDSFIRKMEGDEIGLGNFSAAMRAALEASSRTPAHEMLGHFVDFGIKNHKARNYMLFLVGHGMIVGRDMFLPDEDPVSAITLKELKTILKKFVQDGETPLRLLALHSCSMSSLEVAYQLRGTADYMMAHQGPAFVNSWPYRQLLKKILNTIDREKQQAARADRSDAENEEAIKKKQVNVDRLVEKLYFHCLHNATDFLSAGYSADMALCNLAETKLSGIKEPLQQLVRKLKTNLVGTNIVKDLILLAHWDSQSFWEENYTDLHDFCLCLRRRCEAMASTLGTNSSAVVKELEEVGAACDRVIEVLRVVKSRKRSERFSGLVIRADNFGTKYHYARGLSVYFPWCEPLDDDRPIKERLIEKPKETGKARSQTITETYASYDFNVDLGDDSWSRFLDLYFTHTKRRTRQQENQAESGGQLADVNLKARVDTLLEFVAENFNVDGSLSSRTPETGHRTPETGVGCTCPTIKNYPTYLDDQNRKLKTVSATAGVLQAFRPELQDLEEEPVEDDDNDGE